jgi:hypothetical protein
MLWDRMRVEIFNCGYADLQINLLPRLRGRVFHVTDAKGFAGICQSGFIETADGHQIKPRSNAIAPTRFGPSRGYVCLIDLRNASDSVIEESYGFYYFLDPEDADENIFLFLNESGHSLLIPNAVGLNTRGAAAVPGIEVWYPGPISVKSIDVAIRVPMLPRPDPYALNLDMEAFRKLFPNG